MAFRIPLERYKTLKEANVGYVLREHLSELERTENPLVTLAVANEVIWGCFTIPDAIGFSAPLDSLGDLKKAFIDVGCDSKDSQIMTRFRCWSSSYSLFRSRIFGPKTYKIKNGDVTCTLCDLGLDKGDEVVEFQCRHRFHKECMLNVSARSRCEICGGEGGLPSLEGLSLREKLGQVMKEWGF